MAELSEKEFNGICQAIGFISYTWSNVESLLDYCIAAIYHEHSSHYAPNGQIPVSLKAKTKFMKKSLRNIDSLLPFKQDGLALMERISKISQERHDMIHSRLSGVNASHYEFSKIDYLADIHKIRNLKFTINDFHQTGKIMLDLANDMAQFYQRLINPL